jgi:hypothetical protein
MRVPGTVGGDKRSWYEPDGKGAIDFDDRVALGKRHFRIRAGAEFEHPNTGDVDVNQPAGLNAEPGELVQPPSHRAHDEPTVGELKPAAVFR